MTELARERCVACRPDSPTVTPSDRVKLSEDIPAWQVINDGTDKLERNFAFPDFAGALAFTSAVGSVAEEQGHHPEITLSWGQASIRWWTHTIGGLHRNDFIMAAKSDALYADRSPQ